MPLTDSALNSQALVIKNETIVKANTAIRVGTMLQDIIDNKINNDKISTNPALGTSNTLVPSQAAVKSYVDSRPVPTLNQVLTVGNVSTITPFLPSVNFGTTSNSGQISFGSDTFTFGDSLPNNICEIKDGEITIISNGGTIDAKITSSLLSANRNFNLPDKSGTIALTSDLPSKVFIASISQSGSDNEPTVNNVIKNTFVGAITFSVWGNGEYSVNSVNNEFTLNKTVISIINGSTTTVKFAGASALTTSQGILKTFNSSGVAADDLLNNDIIKIEVYP